MTTLNSVTSILLVLIFVTVAYRIRDTQDNFLIKRELSSAGTIGLIIAVVWTGIVFLPGSRRVNKEVFPVSTMVLCVFGVCVFANSTGYILFRAHYTPPALMNPPPDISTFELLLKSWRGRASLREFLQREFAVESLLYWTAVQEYKRKVRLFVNFYSAQVDGFVMSGDADDDEDSESEEEEEVEQWSMRASAFVSRSAHMQYVPEDAEAWNATLQALRTAVCEGTDQTRQEKLMTLVDDIIDIYVSDESPFQICIDSEVTGRITECIKKQRSRRKDGLDSYKAQLAFCKALSKVFDEALLCVHVEMITETYPRYVRSKLFKELADEIMTESQQLQTMNTLRFN
jgi:hypothetical protein